MINTNLGSLFNMCRPVIEGMRERKFGRIVNISSINGQKGQIGPDQLFRRQGRRARLHQGAGAGRRALAASPCNAICPGYINTEMVQAVPKDVLEKNILPLIPIGRLGEPEEIARCVVFLASDDAGLITGATLSANGGQFLSKKSLHPMSITGWSNNRRPLLPLIVRSVPAQDTDPQCKDAYDKVASRMRQVQNGGRILPPSGVKREGMKVRPRARTGKRPKRLMRARCFSGSIYRRDRLKVQQKPCARRLFGVHGPQWPQVARNQAHPRLRRRFVFRFGGDFFFGRGFAFSAHSVPLACPAARSSIPRHAATGPGRKL